MSSHHSSFGDDWMMKFPFAFSIIMSPVFHNFRPAVFFDPADFEDMDAILHHDDDPIHSTHVCMNCRRIESPNNVWCAEESCGAHLLTLFQKLIPCARCKTVFYCDVVVCCVLVFERVGFDTFWCLVLQWTLVERESRRHSPQECVQIVESVSHIHLSLLGHLWTAFYEIAKP